MVIVSDLIRKISETTSVPADRIRIREHIACQFKEIYSEEELIMRIKTKTVVWEQFEGEPQRGTQIYYRVFDPINMEVCPLREIFVDGNASYE